MRRPLIYDNPEINGPGVKRIKEDLWFKQQQRMLLWMANTDYGRDLLCIPKEYGQIVEISKRHVKSVYAIDFKLKRVHYQYDFRIGCKWGNVIRFRWRDFQAYAQHYYLSVFFPFGKTVLQPVAPVGRAMYTTTTAYPDPDPESATVDGFVANDPAGAETWTNIQGAATGTSAGPSSAFESFARISHDSSTDTFDTLKRGIFLYDTSGIPDAEVIDSGTFSGYGKTLTDSYTAGTDPNLSLFASTPASNTDITTADYDQVGTTAFTNAPITAAAFSTSGYNDIVMNAAGLAAISKTGITKLGTRDGQYDAPNSAPTWENSASTDFICYYADQAGTGNDPKLVVVSSVPLTVDMWHFNQQPQHFEKTQVSPY